MSRYIILVATVMPGLVIRMIYMYISLKKKTDAEVGIFLGAAEQNLLKLFQAIIEGTVSSPIVSEQNETKANLIIY